MEIWLKGKQNMIGKPIVALGHFLSFDIDGVESQPPRSGSWVNEDEVDFIVLMYHKLASQYPELKSGSQLAAISPYRHQVKLLRDRFRATFDEMSDQVVDINTVDGFQGREKDVAIFSCVRVNTGKGIGFVSDFRRMNVGITRTRSSVLVAKPHSSVFRDSNLESLRVKPKVKMEERLQQMENDLAQLEASNYVEDDHNQDDGDGGGYDED